MINDWDAIALDLKECRFYKRTYNAHLEDAVFIENIVREKDITGLANSGTPTHLEIDWFTKRILEEHPQLEDSLRKAMLAVVL